MYGKAYDDNPFETVQNAPTKNTSSIINTTSSTIGEEKKNYTKYASIDPRRQHRLKTRYNLKYKQNNLNKPKLLDYGNNQTINNEPQLCLVEKQKKLKDKTHNIVDNCLVTCLDTENIAIDTLVTLDNQTKQISKINKNLNEINSDLNHTQFVLNGMQSWFGSFKNMFKKVKKDKPYKNIKTKQNKKNEKHNKIILKENKNINNVNNNGLCDDSDDELNNKLDELYKSVKRINCMAQDTNYVLGKHNEMLKETEYGIDKAEIKLKKQNRQMSNIY